jgi:hypothetical protein
MVQPTRSCRLPSESSSGGYTVQVDGSLQLIKELAFDNLFCYDAIGVFVLGDDGCSISIDLGDTERQIHKHVQVILVEAREVSTSNVS